MHADRSQKYEKVGIFIKKCLPCAGNVIVGTYFSTYPFVLMKSPERGGCFQPFSGFSFFGRWCKERMAPEEGDFVPVLPLRVDIQSRQGIKAPFVWTFRSGAIHKKLESRRSLRLPQIRLQKKSRVSDHRGSRSGSRDDIRLLHSPICLHPEAH